jgi:hypothetical protein
MAKVTRAKYFFTALGILLLGLAAYLYLDARSFVAEAVAADGTVIRLDPVRIKYGTRYRPAVRFSTARGAKIEFSSSSRSNSPAYFRGASVRVLYRPADPYGARIDSYSALWGNAATLAIVGAIFLSVGGGVIYWTRPRRHKFVA